MSETRITMSERELANLLAQASRAENEACARLVESSQRGLMFTAHDAGIISALKQKLAAAIRARSEGKA